MSFLSCLSLSLSLSLVLDCYASDWAGPFPTDYIMLIWAARPCYLSQDEAMYGSGIVVTCYHCWILLDSFYSFMMHQIHSTE